MFAVSVKTLAVAAIYFCLIGSAFGQSKNENYKFSEDITSSFNRDTSKWKYQLAATAYSISGYYQLALQARDKQNTTKPVHNEPEETYLSDFEAVSAKDYIIRRSQEEQIIIINEAHHNAAHRTLTRSLLQGLYNNGYRYLGLEGLFDTAINDRGFPVVKSGFYTKEPEFGNLISEALKIGFILFGYEASNGESGKEREIAQAKNIQHFIENNPPGKVLIHCGYAHVYENEYRAWEKAMAGRIKEFLAIDPFTIDQVPFSEKGSDPFNHYFIKRIDHDYPVVLIDKDGKPFSGLNNAKNTDLVIIYPKTRLVQGRPVWLTKGRTPYKLPPSKAGQLPMLILAYRENEFLQGGIPADIIEIVSAEAQADALFLKKGSYEIVIKGRDYKIIEQYTISVD